MFKTKKVRNDGSFEMVFLVMRQEYYQRGGCATISRDFIYKNILNK